MKIVRIRGGLGNQMFQYAFCEWLKKFDSDIEADASEFWCFDCHDGFEVEKIFNIKFNKAKIKDIVRYADYIPIPIKGRVAYCLFKYMDKYEEKKAKKRGHKTTHIEQKEFNALTEDEITALFQKEPNMYLDGYWNFERYYNAIDYLSLFSFRKEFVKDNEKYVYMLNTKNSCSVHIRRGDYVNTSYDILGKEYYMAAMELLQKKNPDITFYVFSDDISVARNWLGERNNIKYMDIKDKRSAGVDMMLMSMCEHNIIANSTFSFWGAKLNRNPDKIVIAPSKYDNNKTNRVLADKDWIII